MQKACKLNEHHEYTKDLFKRCKNMELQFQVQSGFVRELQRDWEGMRVCFWLLLTQWMSNKWLALIFGSELASMHDFSFKLFAIFLKFGFCDFVASNL